MERRPVPLDASPADTVALDLRLIDGPALAQADRRHRRLRGAVHRRSTAFELPDPTSPRDAAVCAHPEVWQSVRGGRGRAMDGGALYEYLTAAQRTARLRRHRGAGRRTSRRSTTPPTVRRAGSTGYLATGAPASNPAWQPAASSTGSRARRPTRRAARRCTSPTSTTTARSTGTASTSTRRRDARRRRAAGRGRRSAHDDHAHDDPGAAHVRGHAAPALVGDRGRAHELRRDQARHDRPGEAALHRVRPRLLERLVHRAGHAAGWLDRRGARARRHERVRRADLDRGRRAPGPTTTGSAGACSRVDVTRRGRAQPADTEPAAPADGAEGAGERAARRGGADPRRDGQHGLGDREDDSRAGRRRAIGRRGRRARRARTSSGWSRRRPAAPAAPLLRERREDPLRRDEQRARALDPVRSRCARTAAIAAIELQRAALPRIIEGDPAPPMPVRPRTSLLRSRARRANPQPYFVPEEEVPRAGARVTLGYQRTRWLDGRVFVWSGVAQADRPRRGLERAGVRPPDRSAGY